jgi:hypothetical protein
MNLDNLDSSDGVVTGGTGWTGEILPGFAAGTMDLSILQRMEIYCGAHQDPPPLGAEGSFPEGKLPTLKLSTSICRLEWLVLLLRCRVRLHVMVINYAQGQFNVSFM